MITTTCIISAVILAKNSQADLIQAVEPQFTKAVCCNCIYFDNFASCRLLLKAKKESNSLSRIAVTCEKYSASLKVSIREKEEELKKAETVFAIAEKNITDYVEKMEAQKGTENTRYKMRRALQLINKEKDLTLEDLETKRNVALAFVTKARIEFDELINSVKASPSSNMKS